MQLFLMRNRTEPTEIFPSIPWLLMIGKTMETSPKTGMSNVLGESATPSKRITPFGYPNFWIYKKILNENGI